MLKTYAFPGNIEDDILAIGAQQVPYMRTSEFSELNKGSEAMLNDLIGNSNGKSIICTASGTAAMEAVIANYVSTRRLALVIDGGTFGHRWSQLCDYHHCAHVDIKLEFGKDIDYTSFEAIIADRRPDTLLCQHHETSSGQLYNLPLMAEICHKYNVSMVVDVISSFLVEDINMEQLGIDVCITSSQKGLNIPPGLSIIFIGKRLLDYPFAHNNYYFDIQDNLSNFKRGQTPFSPATLLFMQLHERLKRLSVDGAAANKARARDNAHYFRELCAQNEWTIPAERPSDAITGFQLSENYKNVVRGLIEDYNTFIMPGSRDGFFRVSHMGLQSHNDLDNLAKQIRQLSMQ